MPIQIWIGGHSLHNPMVQHEMRQECNNALWKCGLIVKVTQRGDTASNRNDMAELVEASWSLAFDVAYLLHPDDEDETLEQMVDPTRLRLELSQTSDTDPRIPQSVEEARLMLVGGEEEEFGSISAMPGEEKEEEAEIDENTGFTKFRTISIKRMTVAKEEETRQRYMLDQQNYTRQQQDETTKRERMEQAKMEEAKYFGAEDSALGAYDVWGQGGYKGVRITEDLTNCTRAGTKRPATTSTNTSSTSPVVVGFKKRTIQKRNVRVTSSED